MTICLFVVHWQTQSVLLLWSWYYYDIGYIQTVEYCIDFIIIFLYMSQNTPLSLKKWQIIKGMMWSMMIQYVNDV